MPKTPAQALLDRVVAAGITPLLRPNGFKKVGRNFRRKGERSVQVVNVQSSAWSSATELRFTLNLGVFFPEVHAVKTFLGWTPSAVGPTEYECQLRARIGRLMPRGVDDWWELAARDDPAPVANRVLDALRTFGLPWLDTHANFQTARAAA